MVRALAIAVVLTLPNVVDAAPCDSLNLGTIVYAQVGDTQTNLMKRLGRALRNNTGRPLALVWKTSGSCANIDLIYNQSTIPAAATMQYVPSVEEDPTWTPTSPTLSCEIAAGSGVIPDIANSALFNSACPGGGTSPAHVKQIVGPTQAYVMAVPEASSQTAITFEEAYFVFGFGTAGGITPWVVETEMFIRTVSKSTLLAWALNLTVPADKWKGVRHDGSPMVVASLTGSTNPNAAIGILGAEVYDGLRNSLNVLAYRAKGQYAAYYPDSTATSRDKKNVRDGHYTVWSPTIWMDRVTGTTPINPDARFIVDLIAGTAAASFDMVSIVSAVGLVPDCAMGVKRSFEGGPLSLYTPAQSCVCKYESVVDTSTCATCSATQACTSGVCRAGFCEVQ